MIALRSGGGSFESDCLSRMRFSISASFGSSDVGTPRCLHSVSTSCCVCSSKAPASASRISCGPSRSVRGASVSGAVSDDSGVSRWSLSGATGSWAVWA